MSDTFDEARTHSMDWVVFVETGTRSQRRRGYIVKRFGLNREIQLLSGV